MKPNRKKKIFFLNNNKKTLQGTGYFIKPVIWEREIESSLLEDLRCKVEELTLEAQPLSSSGPMTPIGPRPVWHQLWTPALPWSSEFCSTRRYILAPTKQKDHFESLNSKSLPFQVICPLQ